MLLDPDTTRCVVLYLGQVACHQSMINVCRSESKLCFHVKNVAPKCNRNYEFDYYKQYIGSTLNLILGVVNNILAVLSL